MTFIIIILISFNAFIALYFINATYEAEEELKKYKRPRQKNGRFK